MRHAVHTLVVLLALSVLLVEVSGAGVSLPQPTLEGWSRYVAAVEGRRRAELGSSGQFLFLDRTTDAGTLRPSVLAGDLLIDEVDGPAPGRPPVVVEGARVHHWRGTVFLPEVTLNQLMTRLETEAPPTSPEVLRATVLDRGPSRIKVYLRLQRTKIVTAVYNTEHEVTFTRVGSRRAESRSVATRIAEVHNPGTPRERELVLGEDRGFLWKLNAYWRYEAVPGGVIAECESISLSRQVPFGVRLIAGPIISSTARESMERTLESLREMAH